MLVMSYHTLFLTITGDVIGSMLNSMNEASSILV